LITLVCLADIKELNHNPASVGFELNNDRQNLTRPKGDRIKSSHIMTDSDRV